MAENSRIPWGVIMVLGFCAVAQMAFAAEPPLEISGITAGTDPVAIVDGKIVQPGDVIAGARVEEITEDSVRFRREDGTEVVRQIKNETRTLGTATVRPAETAAQPAPSLGDPGQEKAKQDFVRAQGYLAEAEKMEQRRILSVMDIQRIISLYESAEWAIKSGIDKIQASPGVESYKTALTEATAKKEKIIQYKRQFEDEIQEGISQKNLVLGMTKTDVERSWGVPADVQKGNFATGVNERWVYSGRKDKIKHLYFADDIFVGLEYVK